MAVFYSPVFQETQFKSDGTLAVGYKIYTYAEGSSTPLTTYTASLGNVAQANPIVLNARGEPNNLIWLTGGLGYKFVLTTDADVVIRTIDNVRGVNDATTTQDQYVTFGGTATYISPTSFSLAGDQTSIFEVGRAVKLLTSGGTLYAKILTSAFTTLTTITVQQATGALDVGLNGTTPSYGLITNSNNSLPASIDARAQKQSATAFTTGGTAPAFTVTTSPIYSSFANDQEIALTMHAANAGVACTLNKDGLGAVSLKQYSADGTLIDPTFVVNQKVKWWSNGTVWIMENALPLGYVDLKPFTAVHNTPANAFTVTVTPRTEYFRGAVLTSGSANSKTNTVDATFVGSSGSTFGLASGVEGTLAVLLVSEVGSTFAIAVVNAESFHFDESQLITTVAEGGAGGADSATTIYSTAAITARPWKLGGIIKSNQAASGTYVSAFTLVQPAGGEASIRAAMHVKDVAAPMFACRAWVVFNGTGTLAIRASGNVSSVTDNGAGDYTVNFITAMPDVNYCAVMSCRAPDVNTYTVGISDLAAPTTSALRIKTEAQSSSNTDCDYVSVAIFR